MLAEGAHDAYADVNGKIAVDDNAVIAMAVKQPSSGIVADYQQLHDATT